MCVEGCDGLTSGPISDPVTIDDCMITFDTPTGSLRQATYGFRQLRPSEVVLTLYRSIFKIMPLNPRFERRIKGTATSVAVSSFELNQRVLLLHLGIRCSSSNRDCKTISILAAAYHRSSDVFIYFASKVLGQTQAPPP